MNKSLPIVTVIIGCIAGGFTAYFNVSDPGDDYRALMGVAQSPAQGPVQGLHGLGPRARIPETEYEFGIMDRGEEKSHVFTVYNDGDEPLSLALVNTTCKCAIGKLPGNAIPPGGSGEITMEWSARTYDRQYQQSATIESNDPRTPVFMLSVAGRVAHIVQAYPSALSFSDVTVNDTRTGSFKIYGFREGDLRVVNYDWNDPDTQAFFDVAFAEADEAALADTPEAKSAIVATVTMKPGMPRGGFQQGLQVTTNLSESTIVEVPIRGRIISDVTLNGPGYSDHARTLKIGLVNSREGATRSLMVLVKGPHRDTVTLSKGRIEPAEALDIEIGEPTRHSTVIQYPVKVIVRPGLARSAAWLPNHLGGSSSRHPTPR